MFYFFSIYIITLTFLIFFSGFLGMLLWQKNLVLVILSLEIIFISSSIGFILSSIMIDDIFGFLFSLFLLTLAGAEVSFGLALTILSYRKFDNIFLNNLTRLKS